MTNLCYLIIFISFSRLVIPFLLFSVFLFLTYALTPLPFFLHLFQSVLHLCLPIIYPINPSILKAGQSFLAFRRYKLGADSALFSQEYTDPSQDAAGAPYTSFGGDDLDSPEERGGQANSDRAFDGTGGYQRQDF